MLSGAEEGVHRPVAVGRDEDHRPGGRFADVGCRGDELDARCGQVVPIEFAQLVRCNLADEAGAATQRGDASRGVARRSAANLVRRPHVRIEPLRLLGVDQPHRAFDQAFARQEIVVGIGDHIDDGIADAQDIEARVGHSTLRGNSGKARRLAAHSHSDNRHGEEHQRRSNPRTAVLDCFAALAMTGKIMRRIIALSLVLPLAACMSRQPQPPVAQPVPVQPQPVEPERPDRPDCAGAGWPVRRPGAADPRGQWPEASVPRPSLRDGYLSLSVGRVRRVEGHPCRYSYAQWRRL